MVVLAGGWRFLLSQVPRYLRNPTRPSCHSCCPPPRLNALKPVYLARDGTIFCSAAGLCMGTSLIRTPPPRRTLH